MLHVAITIFTRKDLCELLHPKAEEIIRDFVFKAKSNELYGKEILHYNFHSLLHLADDAKRYGVLDNTSAFIFENELHRIKYMIRGKSKPL